MCVTNTELHERLLSLILVYGVATAAVLYYIFIYYFISWLTAWNKTWLIDL